MMTKSACTLLIILSINWLEAQAQYDSTTLKSIYEKEVIYFNAGKFLKDDSRIKNLKNEFRPNTEAFRMYQSYLSDYRQSKYWLLTWAALYTTGILVSDKNSSVGTGLIIGSLFPIFVTVKLQIRGGNKLQRAIWLGNKDVLLQRY